MKKVTVLCLIAFVVCFIGTAGVAQADVLIDEKYFPDIAFRRYISKNFDTDGDKVLSDEEIQHVTYMNIDVSLNKEYVLTLKGIEYFTALRTLYCRYGQLSELDLSKNITLEVLDCSNNQLTALDVSGCTSLTSLYCSNNQLTTLDVSNNVALGYLYCNKNHLKEIDVSNKTALHNLNCPDNNLTKLNVDGCTALTMLWCNSNQLTKLDISDCTALTYLYCSDNHIPNLNLSNCTDLRGLSCFSNQLPALDINNNMALSWLSCSSQIIYVLNITETGTLSYPYQFNFSNCMSPDNFANVLDVQGIDIRGSTISTIYADGIACFTSCPIEVTYKYRTGYGLMDVTVYNGDSNSKVKINEENFPDEKFREYVSNYLDYNENGVLGEAEITNVTYMDLSSIGISTLKGIEYFTALTHLDCSNNRLTTLDVSKNIVLERLYCWRNRLTALDVSNNRALTWLECSYNQLTELDVSNNKALMDLYCQNNNITELDLKSCPNVKIYCDPNVKVILKDDTKPTIATSTTTLTIPTGTAFSLQLVATGTTPITWTKTGSLPTGLSLSKEGLISGTPKSAQTKTFKVTAKNKIGSDTKSFTITTYVPVSITTAKLTDGTADKNYNVTLKAKGSNVVWSATGLPDGLSINAKTGKISGKTSKYGEYNVKVRADNSSTHEEKTFTLTIKGVAPTISGSLKTPELNKAYSSGFTAKGTQPIEWSISGNLPDGLEFDEETGVISGTPTSYLKSGYKVTITAKGPGGSKSKTVTLRVKGTAPTITGTLKQAELYKAYSAALKVKGSDTIKLSMSGKLPDGLTFNASTGEISGTPKSYEKSGYKFTITATNPVGSKSKTFTLKVKGTAPTLSGSLKSPELNKAYSGSFKVKGTEPIEWSLTGTLPDGLTFDEETGTISGTPKSYEKSGYKITITASNIVGTKSKKITLKVKGTAPSIKTTKLPNATQWSSYSVALNATGSDPITWRADGLPNGLSLNGNTIEGTPTVSGKKFTVTVYAENPVKEVKKNLSLRIDAAEKPDTVKDTKSPKDTETSPTEPTDKSTPPELPEQEVPESPQDNEDTSHSDGEYVIVARLGEISRDVEGMYDFDVTISDNAVIGAELVYIANSSKPSNDDEIAEFFEDTGKEVTEVPDSRHITISIWLHANTIYNPSIAVKR